MRLSTLSAGLFFLMLVVGTASAATMTATYRGAVSDSWDHANLFGAGTERGALNGLHFTARYIFDTETPGAIRTTEPGYDSISGGSYWGSPSPMRSSSLTMNGHTLQVSAKYEGGASATGEALQHGSVFSIPGKFGQLSASAQKIGTSFFPTNMETPFQHQARRPFGEVFFNLSDSSLDGDVYSRLAIHSVRVAPVPIPAPMGLLVGGIAILGCVGLRRRLRA